MDDAYSTAGTNRGATVTQDFRCRWKYSSANGVMSRVLGRIGRVRKYCSPIAPGRKGLTYILAIVGSQSGIQINGTVIGTESSVGVVTDFATADVQDGIVEMHPEERAGAVEEAGGVRAVVRDLGAREDPDVGQGAVIHRSTSSTNLTRTPRAASSRSRIHTTAWGGAAIMNPCFGLKPIVA